MKRTGRMRVHPKVMERFYRHGEAPPYRFNPGALPPVNEPHVYCHVGRAVDVPMPPRFAMVRAWPFWLGLVLGWVLRSRRKEGTRSS